MDSYSASEGVKRVGQSLLQGKYRRTGYIPIP